MARIRTIKPEFWCDEKLSQLDPITRLVFLGLIGMADDCGRILDNVKVIDAFIFPNTSDTCREALATLSRMRRIRCGVTASGQKAIQIVKWEDHQKVDKPNLSAALPEIVTYTDVAEIRDELANDSRGVREEFATHTNDQRPTTTTPTPPAKSGGGGFSGTLEVRPKDSQAIDNVVEGLTSRGVGRAREAVDAAIARGVSVAVLWDVIGYWDSAHGALEAGALYDRIRRAEVSQTAEAGWPKHERPGKPKRPKKPPGSDAMAVVREMRKRGRSEAEIDQELRRLGLHEELANA